MAPGPASVMMPKAPDGIFWPAEMVINNYSCFGIELMGPISNDF
jgi:hypothetical protein